MRWRPSAAGFDKVRRGAYNQKKADLLNGSARRGRGGYIMRKQKILGFLMALSVLLCGCGLFGGGEQEPDLSLEEQEYPVTIGGEEVLSRPSTVASLSPSATEKLVDLGMADRLVGVSDYCGSIPEAAELPACGTAMLPDLEKLLEIHPHVVVSETALSSDDADALRQMDIYVVELGLAKDLEGWLESYVSLSRLLEGDRTGREMGEAFAGRQRRRMESLEQWFGGAAGESGGQKVLYLRYLDYTAATGDTLEHSLMERIGLENIAAEYTGWALPEEDLEALREKLGEADWILADVADAPLEELKESGLYGGLGAVSEGRVIPVDSTAFERQSARMLDELEAVGAAVYPDANPPEGYTPAERAPEGDLEEDLSDDPLVAALDNLPKAEGQEGE